MYNKGGIKLILVNTVRALIGFKMYWQAHALFYSKLVPIFNNPIILALNHRELLLMSMGIISLHQKGNYKNIYITSK